MAKTPRIRKQKTPGARAPAGARITTLDPAMLQPMVETIVRESINQTISSLRTGDFLGPQQPIGQVAPEDAPSRAWEYPPGYNVSIQPRKYTPISAQQLQWIADNLDVLRQVMERRKAELTSLDWEIVSLNDEKDASKDPRVLKLKEFFRFPGGRDWPWVTWLGSLLEDVFVIDARTIEPRYTYGGDVFSLDIVTGASIVPLIDDTGRITESGHARRAARPERRSRGPPRLSTAAARVPWRWLRARDGESPSGIFRTVAILAKDFEVGSLSSPSHWRFKMPRQVYD